MKSIAEDDLSHDHTHSVANIRHTVGVQGHLAAVLLVLTLPGSSFRLSPLLLTLSVRHYALKLRLAISCTFCGSQICETEININAGNL